MTDFLLELRSEEIPARMQDDARQNLRRLFIDEIAKSGLTAQSIETFATPRRLALIAYGLPVNTQAVSEEIKGPKLGAPPQALEGFLRKTGLMQDQLVVRDGVYFAVIDKPGRPTADVLAEAIPAIIRAFPWPKSMRWGDPSISTESLRWVRPLQGIVTLFGEDIVPCDVDAIVSGAVTKGHRFHHSGPVTITSAADYEAKLRAAHVIADQEERRAIIRNGATKIAADAGLVLVQDDALVDENAGLTEWPVPLLGRFDPAFLDVPREVIQLTMRTNQKYFACADIAGALANAFVCTANIEASDGGAAVIAGNEKVLSARLSDAKFFWAADLKVPLADQATRLSQIVFHEKLGTVADKAERVAKLARWLVESGVISPSPLAGEGLDLAHLAETAARLCKADLVTGMVSEFPELQGIMGGYYARAQGYPDAVADAIRDHYKLVGQGDDVPTVPVTVAVSLADKLDTLFHFFAINEKPTGSKDPFALRRAMIGVNSLILVNDLRIGLIRLGKAFNAPIGREFSHPANDLVRFAIDRLKVQQREAGVRHDLIDAVFALGGEDDLVRLLSRVKALQSFVTTDEGKNLLAGYKRAANILKKEGVEPLPFRGGAGVGTVNESPASVRANTPHPNPSPEGEGLEIALSYTSQNEEHALINALDSAEPLAAAAIAREDFEAAMSALASLRAPIDAFFEGVMVNDADPAIRAFRLGLLTRFRDAVHTVADFSKIEG